MNDIPDPIQRKLCEYLIPADVHVLSRTSRDMHKAFKRYVFHSFKTRLDKILLQFDREPRFFERLKAYFPSLYLTGFYPIFFSKKVCYYRVCFSVLHADFDRVFSDFEPFLKAFPLYKVDFFSTIIFGEGDNVWISSVDYRNSMFYDGSTLCLGNE